MNRGVLLTGIASALWGTAFVATQVGLERTNPYVLVFLRFGVASATILVVSQFVTGVSLGRELRSGSTWLMGGVYALGFLFRYVGQADASASEASLLSNLAPTLVPLLAVPALSEQIGRYQKFATLLGFLGLLLVAAPSLELGSERLLGDVLLFSTSVCIAVFILLGKKNRANSVSKAFGITFTIGLFLAPAAVVFGGGDFLNLGWGGWTSVLYLGIPCSVVALALYLKGLGTITASQSATLLFVQLLVGFVLSTIIFGAPYEVPEIAGASIISVAIILASVQKT